MLRKTVISLFLFSLLSCNNSNKTKLLIENNLIVTEDPLQTINALSNQNLLPSYSDKELKQKADELRKVYSNPNKFEWPKAFTDQEIEHKELGLLPNPQFPKDNLYSKDKEILGKELFFEKRLSGNNTLSCASCHQQSLGWTDHLSVPKGIDGQDLGRNTPTILNTAHYDTYFWDGRSRTLEDQSIAVILNPRELNMNPIHLKPKLYKDYGAKFQKAFGSDTIDLNSIGKAIATFERTINSKNNSKFDQFLKGNKNILSDSQIRGLHLFRTKARCINCHNGPNLTDNKFHNIGLTHAKTKYEDFGRFNITQDPSDMGKFKTQSLRNISETKNYFHHGLLLTLKGVIRMYSMGMPGDANKSKHIKPLGLSFEEAKDLEEFLNSLKDQ